MVDALKGNWADELENILWEIWTTPKKYTRETPFCLVYELKAVAPYK